jgi:hypothetical protein
MVDLAGEDHRSLSLFRGLVPLARGKLMQNATWSPFRFGAFPAA